MCSVHTNNINGECLAICGISAWYNSSNAINMVSMINESQISRGRDATGIAFIEGGKLKVVKKSIPAIAFNNRWLPKKSKAPICIGHVRAASTNIPERTLDKEAHPFLSENGEFAVVHNGHVLYHEEYRYLLRDIVGHNFSSGVDSEVYVHCLEELLKRYNREEAVTKLLETFNHGNVLILFRDGELYGIPSTTAFNVALVGNSVGIASEMGPLVDAIKGSNVKGDITLFSITRLPDDQFVKIYKDKKGIVKLELYGNWEEREGKDGFIPERKVTCDICKNYALCERVYIDSKVSFKKYDRCYECFKAGKVLEEKKKSAKQTKIGLKRRGQTSTRFTDESTYAGDPPPKAKCVVCGNFYNFHEKLTYCCMCRELYCHDCFEDSDKHRCFEERLSKKNNKFPIKGAFSLLS